MIAPVARCLSMMLEYSYLLREDEQLMHECHQQKLHLYNILRELHTYHGLKQQLLLRSYHHIPSEWGWNKSMGDAWEVHWTTLPEVTRACRELI